jgi:cytidyltransferase-like protein
MTVSDLAPYGVAHGRFQLFHKGHFAYVREAKRRCRHLIVGIANPDPSVTRFDPADPNRSRPEANPFTYFERMVMIRDCLLLDAGFDPDEFSFVPFPINKPDLLRYYVPKDASFYLTIFGDWGLVKQQVLIEQGFKVEVFSTKRLEDKEFSSTRIRQQVIDGNKAWEELVPRAVIKRFKEMKLDDYLQSLATKADIANGFGI